MAIDIFQDQYRMQSTIFNFENVGDQIQGTYVRKSEAKSKYTGLMEPLYEIRTPEGEYFTIWGKPIINQQMAKVRIGQIVGFKLIEKRKTDKGNPANIIQVFADPKLVDEDFLRDMKELGGVEEAPTEEGVVVEEVSLSTPTAPAPASTPTAPVETLLDVDAQITELAKTKFGLKTEAEIKQRVMEVTGLAWIGTNLNAILEKMKTI